MARWTFQRALREIGLPSDFQVRTPEAFDLAMAEWKRLTVAARLINDDNRAAILSLCKNIIKKRHEAHISKICPKCGQGKSQEAVHCGVCYRAEHYAYDLDYRGLPMHEIESTLTAVPYIERRQGELVKILKKMATGEVGDSFVTNRSSSSVQFMAKTLGGQVICRIANPQEKDHKKRQYRVWRSDGLSMDEVNAIIKKRLAKETVPECKNWVPMTPEEMRVMTDRKHPKQPHAGRPSGKK